MECASSYAKEYYTEIQNSSLHNIKLCFFPVQQKKYKIPFCSLIAFRAFCFKQINQSSPLN